MTLPTTSPKSSNSDGNSLLTVVRLILIKKSLVNSMNTSCTSSNFHMNPFFSTLFPNLTSQQQQQQQQQLLTQLLLSGK